MKNLFLLYSFLIFSCFYSQQVEGEIIYKTKYKTHKTITGIEKVYFTNDIMLSLYKADEIITTPITENGSVIYPTNTIDSLAHKPRFVLLSSKDNTLFNNNINNDKETIYKKENAVKTIEWKIFPEYKKIKGYKCQKAQATISGSLYTVWFTKKIPTSFAPTGVLYSGLGGAILEMTTDKFQRTLVADKISLKKVEKIISDFKKKQDLSQYKTN
ncbi:MAG: GLPGLI family protein [Bergeyella zoohelcum]|nr:GLPGLI family protein [Bergeyella zoohelcum]